MPAAGSLTGGTCLAAYLGSTAAFDHAIAGFAKASADQDEHECAALQATVKEGKAEAGTTI